MQGNAVANTIASDRLKAVVGMGATGLSVARYLRAAGERFVMLDTRANPPGLDQFKAEYPDIPVALGELSVETLLVADEVIVSPGVPLQSSALQSAAEQGVNITGDIQLFADAAKAPIVAITGSNGKSTVTSLLGQMCRDAGRKVAVGGNLGTPALELLSDECELYVLELSSFQLEAVRRLGAEVAVVLNVSPDHMDRYTSLPGYHAAKHRIFSAVRQVVVNRDDTLSEPLVADTVKRWSFGLGEPDFHGFGIRANNGEQWLAYQFECLMPVSEVAIKGSHNIANALAALALGSAVGLPMQSMLETLRHFAGLPHRCQTVGERHGVIYINDSKATNLGATLAAIDGLASHENLVLIAGGQGKGQDFSALASQLSGRVKKVVLLGEAAVQLAESIGAGVDTVFADSMTDAVNLAAGAAVEGDIVLLSPACASFDMFKGFEDRGEQFAAAVEGLS